MYLRMEEKMERALDMFRVLTGETAQNPGSGSMITTLLMLGAMGLVLYFFMYRPQKKQKIFTVPSTDISP